MGKSLLTSPYLQKKNGDKEAGRFYSVYLFTGGGGGGGVKHVDLEGLANPIKRNSKVT